MTEFSKKSNVTRAKLLNSSAVLRVPYNKVDNRPVSITYSDSLNQSESAEKAREWVRVLFSGAALLEANYRKRRSGYHYGVSYFPGSSGYEISSVLHHRMWMRENIASLVVTFTGAASALSFLRSTNRILNAWFGRRNRGKRITIRTDHLTLDIYGIDDVESAVKAFQTLSIIQHRDTSNLEELSMRILFLAANPKTTSHIDLEEELRSLQTELRGVKYRDQILLTAQHAVRPDDLVRYVRSERPTVVHFSGHGSGRGIVVRNDEGGHTEVTGDGLQRFFLNRGVQLVVLNACYSREQAKLLPNAVAAVVGTTDAEGDVAARRFTVAFYRALGEGYSIREAFRDGVDAAILANEKDVFWSDGKLDQLLVKPGKF